MTIDDRNQAWIEELEGMILETQHTPYRVGDYVGWQRDGSLELRPNFQRGSVWKQRDKSFLIDSIVKGYPLPLLVLQDEVRSEHPRMRRRVVDGQQRLRTLIAFVDRTLLKDEDESDSFRYFPPELGKVQSGFTFQALGVTLQNRILNTTISAVLLGSNTGTNQILEVYDRLNSTGLGLTPQELRFARRDGQFAEISYELARHNQVRWTSWRLFRDQDIARMAEVEFTSELILLIMNGVIKTGRHEIDTAYKDPALAAAIPSQAEIVRTFQAVMDTIDELLARPGTPDRVRMFRSKGWFYALFAFCIAHQGLLDDTYLRNNKKPHVKSPAQLVRDVIRLGKIAPGALAKAREIDPELIRSISGSASDRASRSRRLTFLLDLI